ncbi:hypothetical protein BAC3_02380 [uncultured bacterium]|nr:hypothetical protein BAC3_02380 [uncultured bacterium]
MSEESIVHQIKMVNEENKQLVRKYNDVILTINELIELRNALKMKVAKAKTAQDALEMFKVFYTEEGRVLDRLRGGYDHNLR